MVEEDFRVPGNSYAKVRPSHFLDEMGMVDPCMIFASTLKNHYRHHGIGPIHIQIHIIGKKGIIFAIPLKAETFSRNLLAGSTIKRKINFSEQLEIIKRKVGITGERYMLYLDPCTYCAALSDFVPAPRIVSVGSRN